MTRTIHCSAVIALALASGCAGASMSRAVDEDGGLGSGEDSSDGGTLPPTTNPSGDPSSDTDPTADPTVDPGSSDGADSDPSTTSPDDSSGTLPGSSSDEGEPESSSSSDAASTGEDSSSGGTPIESSSDDGDTAPLDDVDLSGYTIVQTDSAREIVLPDDAVVPLGGCLVVGRDASAAAFQAFWDVSWGDEVVYIDGANEFPNINGDETYSLRSPDDALLEGPTPALDAGTAVWRGDADDVDAWNVDMAPDSGSTPGSSDAIGGSSGTPYLSEYSDPTGGFAYEFVEICIAP